MRSFFEKQTKNIIFVGIIVVASCIYVIFSNNHFYLGGDLTFHLNRFVGICDAIRDGQLIPRIYPNTNYGFGYGSAMFYCDLFLYPFAFFVFVGAKPITAYKIMIIFYTVVSAITSLYFSKKIFKKEITSYICTSLFLLSNYRMFDLYDRAAMGEIIALSFIPFVLYSIYRVLVLKEDNYVSLALAFSALVLSHIITTVLLGALFFVCIIIFVILNIKNKKTIIKACLTIFKAIILALLLCSWFIFPMIEQVIHQEFYCFSPYSSFNSYPRVESLVNILNPINGKNTFDILLLLLSFLYLFSKKNKIITGLYIGVWIMFFIMIGYIPFIEPINIIQFMFRLNILIYPFLVIIASYIIDNIESKTYIYVCATAFILIIINLFAKNYFLINDKYNVSYSTIEEYLNRDPYQYYYNASQLGGGEYLPVCNNTDYLNEEKNIILEKMDGEYVGTISNYSRRHSHIDFDYDGDAEFASLPLSYYYGYDCTVDESQHYCVNDEVFEKVGIILEKGKHHYTIFYKGTKVQKISAIVSLSSLIVLVFVTLYKRKTLYKK